MKDLQELPPLNALRAFEACARLGGVNRAAAELHVTHGAVSRHIRALEEAVGVPLFVRDGRGLALTAEGQRLREAASDAFDQLRTAWSALRHGDSEGPLVLGCPGSLLARWVIPRMPRMAMELPDIRLHLSAHEGPFDPALNGLSAALMIGAPPWPEDWKVRELADEWIGPVVSPRYPGFTALSGQPAAILAGEALLHTASRPQAWPAWAAQNTMAPEALRMGTGFEHLYYLLEAAVAGLGVAIAPQQLVADDLETGRLLAPWGFIRTDAAWCLCWPQRHRDARIERLADWLEGALTSRQ